MQYTDKAAFEKVNMFGTGVPNDAYAKYFTGDPKVPQHSSPISPLNRGAAITGTFTTPKTAADSWFSRISVVVQGTETRNEWLERISDDDYDALDDKR